jgi:hypothetical protein
VANDRGARAGSGLVALGVVFMAFGAGGFLGFVVGRSPAFAAKPQDSVLLKLTEKHANEAEYLLRRRAKL